MSLTPSRPLRSGPLASVGVVGVGYLGRFHAQKYARLQAEGRCVFRGVYDPHIERAREVARELKAEAFSDLTLLAAVTDAAVVASATPFHFENASLLLKSGIQNLLIEKPVTHDVESAKALQQEAKSRNAHVFIGHSERFQPTVLQLREHLADAAYIQIERAHPPGTRSATTSVVLDLMIHDLDLILWLLPDWTADVVHVQKFASESVANGCAAVLRVIKGDQQKSIFLRASRVVDQGPTLRKWVYGGSSAENHFDFLQTKADTLLLESEAFLRAIGSASSAHPSLLATLDDGLRALELAVRIDQEGQAC